jgi:hypothetical protein
MNTRRKKSPYLSDPHRLADILAAIQVFGSHRWDSREMKDWQEHLGEKPQSGKSWELVLAEHPEFFGTYLGKQGQMYHYLRLRRAYERTVDPDTLRELTDVDIRDLRDRGQYATAKLARKALAGSQVEALMKTAIELQVRAAALEDRTKWWLPLAAAALGFAGALLGSLLNPKPVSPPSASQVAGHATGLQPPASAPSSPR